MSSYIRPFLLSLLLFCAWGAAQAQSLQIIRPVAVTRPTCFRSNDGNLTLSLTVQGTVGPYTYQVVRMAPSPGCASLAVGTVLQQISANTSVTFNNLCSGTYNVTVFDASATPLTDAGVVDLTQPEVRLTATAIPAGCRGSATGQINLGASGGTPTPGGYSFYIIGPSFPVGNLVFGTAANTFSFNNLVAGAYKVVARDAVACPSDTLIRTVTEPAQALAFGTVTTSRNSSCQPTANGFIRVNITGGVPPYRGVVVGGSDTVTTATATLQLGQLRQGSYDVLIIDAGGCRLTGTYTVAGPNPIRLSVTTTRAACNGTSTASVTGLATGGNGGFSYSLNNSAYQTSGTFNNLPAGVQNLRVIDNQGCFKDTSLVLTEPAPIGVVTTVTDVNRCLGLGSGVIALAATGGTGPYTHTLTPNVGNFSASQQRFTQVVAGTYLLTTTDANNCQHLQTVTVSTGPQCPPQSCNILAALSSRAATCPSSRDGTGVLFLPNAATVPYQYSVNGTAFVNVNQVTTDITGQPAGWLRVIIRDRNNLSCEVLDSVFINSRYNISTTPTVTPVTCSGMGQIQFSAPTGGAGGYEFRLNNGAFTTNTSYTNLQLGLYTYTVRDAAGCTLVDTIRISGQPPLQVTTTMRLPTCGLSNGRIGFTRFRIGTALVPFNQVEYSLNSGPFMTPPDSITGLPSGIYRLQVRAANGQSTCVFNTTINLLGPAALSATAIPLAGSACDTDRGQLRVVTAGGTGPYTYAVRFGNSGPFEPRALTGAGVIDTLQPGSYSLRIVDAAGCTFTTPFQIDTIRTVASVSLTASPAALCPGTPVNFTATATYPVASYLWYVRDSLVARTTANSLTIDTLSTNYPIRVVALAVSRACLTQDSVSGSLIMPLLTPVPARVNLVGLNGAQCVGTSTTFRAFPVDGSGGVAPTYQWIVNNVPIAGNSTDTLRLTNLSSTATVRVIMSSSLPCAKPARDTAQQFLVITSTTTPAVSTVPYVNGVLNPGPYCANTRIVWRTAFAAAGNNPTYAWFVNGVQVNGTADSLVTDTLTRSGNVTVRLFPDNNCATAPFTENTYPVQVLPTGISRALVVANVTTICQSTAVTFTAFNTLTIPGINYAWQVNGFTRQSSSQNTFTTTLNAGDAVRVIATTTLPTTCLVNLPDTAEAQNITVKPVNDPACIPVCTIRLALDTLAQITCAGATNDALVAVRATGGSGTYEYRIKPSANTTFGRVPSFTGMAPGTYWIIVRDSLNPTCKDSLSVVIGIRYNYTVALSVNQPSSCANPASGSIAFSAVSRSQGTGIYQYRINRASSFGTSASFNSLAAGWYFPEVLDTTTRCVIRLDSVQLLPVLPPTATLQQDGGPICAGATNGVAQITGLSQPFSTLQYSLDGTNFLALPNPDTLRLRNLPAGPFVVYLRNVGSQCQITLQTNIAAFRESTIDVVGLTPSGCANGNGTARIRATNALGSTFQLTTWPAGVPQIWATVNDTIIGLLPAGMYQMTLTTPNGCSTSDTFRIVTETPMIGRIQPTASCMGGSNATVRLSQFSRGIRPYSFQLDGGTAQTDSVFIGLTPGAHQVTITDATGCSQTYSVTVPTVVPASFTVNKLSDATCTSLGRAEVLIAAGTPPLTFAYDSAQVGQFTTFKPVVNGRVEISSLQARIGNGYTLLLRDSAGCQYSSQLVMIGSSRLTLDSAWTQSLCGGQASGQLSLTNITGSGPFRVLVIDANSGRRVHETTFPGAGSYVVDGLTSGTYNATVLQEDANCPQAVSFAFTINSAGRPLRAYWRNTLPASPEFNEGEIVIDSIGGGVGPYLVRLDNGPYALITDTLYDKLSQGTHTLYITDAAGCVQLVTLTVEGDTELRAPNIISPNGDGMNDAFVIRNLPAGAAITISDRFGAVVLETVDYNNDWRAEGRPDGTYFYHVRLPQSGVKLSGWLEVKRK